MPLIIEVLSRQDQWEQSGYIVAGEPEGSLSDFSILSGPQVYLFGCSEDDKSSFIRRSVRAKTATIEDIRIVVPEGGCMPIARLNDGEMHSLTLHPDGSLAQRTVRFRHVYLDFGSRSCPLCHLYVPALQFGRHVFNHAAEEFKAWGGNAVDLCDELLLSIDQSHEIAKDFARIRLALSVSRAAIEQLRLEAIRVQATFN